MWIARPLDVTSTESTQTDIANEAIARRAYQKWQQRGCPLWQEEQDWFVARAELERELLVQEQYTTVATRPAPLKTPALGTDAPRRPGL